MARPLILAVVVCALARCVSNQVAGTADDVNSGSILGSIVKDPRSIGDTLTVCLFKNDTSNALLKRQAGGPPLRTLKTPADSYRFDSLASGSYRVEISSDSIVVGKKDNIRLSTGQREEVDVVVAVVITIMISIQSGQNITITDISIDNGKIQKLGGGYVLTIAETDSQSFEIQYNQNGKTGSTRMQIILHDKGTAIIQSPADSLDATITPSYEPDCLVPGAITCLPFDSGRAEDRSGNGNSGRVVGAQPTGDRFGNPSGALLFNGVDNYVIVDTLRGTTPGNSPKSVSGWFNSSKPRKYLQMLFGFGAMVTGNNFQIGVGPTTGLDTLYQFRVNAWGNSYDWRSGISSEEYLDGKWHHCVLTYDGETTKLYFDGTLAAQTSDFNYSTPASPVLVIGREIDLSEWEFDGALDDIRIFNRAIDGNEVLLLYNQHK